MIRALLIAFAGLGYFVISLPMMMPLRMRPKANYNLFYMPFLAIIFTFLFYSLCTVAEESNAYIYAFFAAIFAWQILGEVASKRVPAGYIKQFSSFNLSVPGAYFPVVTGLILLMILWQTQAVKNPVAVFFMVFLGIWMFELYMENYSLKVPLRVMPTVANIILTLFAILTLLLLYIAQTAVTVEKQTVMGCLLYLTITVVIMAAGPWKKPQKFYLKYEPSNIELEMEEMREQLGCLNKLKKEMTSMGMLEETRKDNGDR